MVSRKQLMPALPHVLLFGCICFISISPAAAQTATSSRNYDATTSASNLPIERLGPDDLISMQVYDSPELTRTLRISSDGMLRVPLLTKPLKATGLLPEELEDRLAAELKAEGILVRPIVTVSVAEYRSRPISVVGAVHHPLTFQAVGPVTLIDAITRADGLSETAGSEILINRAAADGGQALVQRVPVKALLSGLDETLNIRLVGGEEIRVPEGGRIFVVGNVHKPGAIPVHDLSESTVLRAISQSEGLMPYAAKEAYILRHDDTAHSNEIPVPLEKIMERKAPDVPLMANDVLYVPDNKSQRHTVETLKTLGAFGMGTLSGILIWHH
jgi:polysaccharide export outer membrane protein